MMISQKVAALLNEQVKNEYFAFYTYQQMAYKLESMNLKVFAKWFTMQAGEEKEHAEKIAKYLLEQGAEVTLKNLNAPKADYASVLEICQAALQHELGVTKNINDLVALARSENDYPTEQFLGWFLAEQVEEVASTTELLEMVKLAGNPGQVLMLEGRVYHMVQERD